MKIVTTSFIWLLAGCAILFPRDSAAQDTHYWTDQYGPHSMLLSGAVIGSVHDMSATFYNPGALGYIAKPDLLVSANAYQIESFTIKDGAGRGFDLNSSHFNVLPNMVAGAFRKSWLGNNKIAYSFLTRHRVDLEIKGGRTAQIDVLPDPGIEQFAGALRETVDAKELWAGVTWAHGLSSKMGVGLTTYLTVRSESRASEILAQALTDSSEIALVFDVDNYTAHTYGLLWKAGVGIDLAPLTLGLTVTTPNVKVVGSGNTTYNSTVVRVDADGDSIPDSSFETNFQEDVDANYHSPWAVGFGFGYFLKQTEFSFSAEWYADVDPYDVVRLAPFQSQATGETVNRSIQAARKSIIDVGAGVRHDFGEKYSGYLSFCTDQSSHDPQSDVSVTGMDLLHVTGGASIATGKTKLMLGLSYAWGSESAQQVIDLDPAHEGSAVNPGTDVEYQYSRLTFLVGFRVGL